jgi:hypothetical protein
MKRIPLAFNEEMLTLYKEGKCLAFIAKKFNCTRFTVRRRLKMMGEYVAGVKYKHTYDRSFFEKVDSDEKARAIGLFGADGAMLKHEFRLTLHKNDEDYLTNIKNLISKDAKLSYAKGSGRAKGEFVGFGIYDKHIRNQLINLGIVRRKSPIYDKPNIDKKFHKAFILGIFEGDGSVFFNKKSNTYYSCNFIGSKKLMGFIKAHLEAECGIEMIEKEKKGTKTPDYSSIYSKSNLDCLKILAYLYSSNVSFFMNRKLERFKRMLDYERLYTEKLSIKKALLDERNQKIIELKKSGVKNSEIAKMFGISYCRAWSISTGKAYFSSLESDLKRKERIFEFAKTQKKKLSNLFSPTPKKNNDDEPIGF